MSIKKPGTRRAIAAGYGGQLRKCTYEPGTRLGRFEIESLSDAETADFAERLHKPTILGYSAVGADLGDGSLEVIPTKAKSFIPLTPLEYIPSLRAIREGRPFAPVSVDFDVTDVCNENCIFCYTAEYRKARAHGLQQGSRLQSLSTDTVRDCLTALRAQGTKHVRFVSGGEPLAYPQLPDVLRHCRDLGLTLTVYTNGTMLGGRAEVLAECADLVRVSVNAGSDASRDALHRSVNPGQSYRRVIRAIGALNEERQSRHREGVMTIGASFLVHETNSAELVEFVEAVASNVDFVTFQCVYGAEKSELGDDEVQTIAAGIEAAVATRPDLDVYVGSRLKAVLARSGIRPEREAAAEWRYCFEAYTMPIVESNGSVKMCSAVRGRDDPGLEIGRSTDGHEIAALLLRHSQQKARYHVRDIMARYCRDCCSFTVNSTLDEIYKRLAGLREEAFSLLYDVPPVHTNLFSNAHLLREGER